MAKEKIKINKKFKTLNEINELIKKFKNDESNLTNLYTIKNELKKIPIKKITKKGFCEKEKNILKKIWDFKILDAIKIQPVTFNMFIKNYDEKWHDSLKIETNKKIIEYEISKKLLPKINFIKYRYKRYSVKEASKIIGISEQTGYSWQKEWNHEGLNGIFPKTRRGPKNRLKKNQLIELKNHIEINENISTKEVKKFIKSEFTVQYTDKQIRIIIKKLKYNEKNFYL